MNMDPECYHDAGHPEHFHARTEPRLTEEQLLQIHAAEQMFETMCRERHEKGSRKYGELTFLEMPTLSMAMEEVADLANYARYTFIRLALLQLQIAEIQDQTLVGKDGFFTTEQIMGIKKKV